MTEVNSTDDIDIEHLITLVSQNSCVWDKSLEVYHNRTATTEAWRVIFNELNPRFEGMSDKEKNIYGKAVLKKWRNIRDRWMKTTKKVESLKKSGAAAKPLKYYVYHEQLSFLKKNSTRSQTESSYAEDPDELSADVSVDDVGVDESNNPALPWTKTKAPTPAKKEGARMRAKVDVEKEILASLNTDDDPYISFFKGIVPRMADFIEDEHLQFQCGVLNLIQSIKRNRIHQPATNPRPFIMQQRPVSSQGYQITSQQWESQSHQTSFLYPQGQDTRHSTGSYEYLQSPGSSESSIFDLDFGKQQTK